MPAWPKPLQYLTCLVLIPVGLLAYVTSPVWIPIAWLIHWWSERRELRRMRSIGRFISWSDLRRRSQDGEIGTLFVEQSQKCAVRLFWTPDDVLAECPHPEPDESEIDYVFGSYSAFMEWVHERYLGPTGSALRTSLWVRYPPGFAKTSTLSFTGFRRIIPAVRLQPWRDTAPQHDEHTSNN